MLLANTSTPSLLIAWETTPINKEGDKILEWINQFVQMLYSQNKADINIDAAYLLKNENLPDVLYKYRAVDKRSLQNLEEGTVWLADPESFNDPYDCATFTDFNELSRATVRTIHPQLFEKVPADKLTIEFKERIIASDNPWREVMSSLLEVNPQKEMVIEAIEGAMNHLNEGMARANLGKAKDSFKLCSFSENVNSMLMWSHYANYHKGFCIEYPIKELSFGDYVSRFMYPVIYSDKIFDNTDQVILGPGHEKFNVLRMNLAGLTKSDVWSYEKEWRLLFSSGILKEPQTWKMPKPRKVYLGANISAGDQDSVINICQKIGVPVLKMVTKASGFTLTPASVEEADTRFFSKKN